VEKSPIYSNKESIELGFPAQNAIINAMALSSGQRRKNKKLQQENLSPSQKPSSSGQFKPDIDRAGVSSICITNSAQNP
jgi:hypothetical protein